MPTIIIKTAGGENRTLKLPARFSFGTEEACDVQLSDMTLPLFSAPVRRAGAGFWIRVPASVPPIKAGDFSFREGTLIAGVTFRMGETEFEVAEPQTYDSLPPQPLGYRPWLTCSDSGARVLQTLFQIARTPLAVYLSGETGTGKEILSQLIHAWSERRKAPFVALNCAAFSPTLVESELFGHIKGAFTGAEQNRVGALLQAHQGTLFLDEIGDLSTEIQSKLLRFLENGEVRPLGSDHVSHSKVRLICATHKNLKQLIQKGRFRRDLYYRVANMEVQIPTLRSRPEDIALLARTFSRESGQNLSDSAILRLQTHPWPGNVRELQHAVWRACGLSRGTKILGKEDFDFLEVSEEESTVTQVLSSTLQLKEMEKKMLEKALLISKGNRKKTAEILGIARSTLFEMLKRHSLKAA